MTMKKKTIATDKEKLILINRLYPITIFVIFLGMFFTFYSLLNHISLNVLSISIPGMVIGFLLLFLGIKCNLSVIKMKSELSKATSNFSWSTYKGKKD